MRAYLVGGAVRDELLGIKVRDRDYVVVGETPERMVVRGFRPVGKDFPVFIHPETGEEHALARTERKSGRGYKGFVFHYSPEVTLGDDLRRRDLTINAIAKSPEGKLIDPYGGVEDLRQGVLRHVSEAFTEDPLRVLRVARFHARFGFRIADETRALLRLMVEQGEIDHLTVERTWAELRDGLEGSRPSLMFAVLDECGALAHIVPELARAWHRKLDQPGPFGGRDFGEKASAVVDVCAGKELPVESRFAALLGGIGSADGESLSIVRQICEALKVSARTRRHAVALARSRPQLLSLVRVNSCEGMVDLLHSLNWPRDRALMANVLAVHGIQLEMEGFSGSSQVADKVLAAGELLLGKPVTERIRDLGKAVSSEAVRRIRVESLRQSGICGEPSEGGGR